MNRSPQIYRDIEKLLSFWMAKKWSDSIPKIYRFSVYPQVLGYVLEMGSASSDAYELKDGKEENIKKVISNLNKMRLVARMFCENRVITFSQMNLIDELSEKISEQTKKWLNSLKNKK